MFAITEMSPVRFRLFGLFALFHETLFVLLSSGGIEKETEVAAAFY